MVLARRPNIPPPPQAPSCMCVQPHQHTPPSRSGWAACGQTSTTTGEGEENAPEMINVCMRACGSASTISCTASMPRLRFTANGPHTHNERHVVTAMSHEHPTHTTRLHRQHPTVCFDACIHELQHATTLYAHACMRIQWHVHSTTNPPPKLRTCDVDILQQCAMG